MDESVFCQYCGYSITGQMRPAQQQVQAKSGMSTGMIVAIVVVVVVVIPTVLAALLYVMVLGFGGYSTQTPTSFLTKLTVTSGVKLTFFAPMSVDTQWSDITILLNDETSTVQWSPATTDLTDGPATRAEFAVVTLGSLSVYCNVTDIGGDGYINAGDHFTLTTPSDGTFSSATTYTCTILYEPTDGEICHIFFSG
jgi:hypothetical protein